jgi:hypothetical protein
MPATQSRIVWECHRYSAQADAIAASASDEQTKAAFLEIAKRWLDIALTYESGEQSIRLRKKRWQGRTRPRLLLRPPHPKRFDVKGTSKNSCFSRPVRI